jgi:hypothetical protein
MAMMNMEGEGIKDVRDFFRQKLIRLGVVKPTQEETEQLMAEMANRPPDPNAIFLQAAAEEAVANAARARADVIDTLANADLKNARIAESNATTIEKLARTDQEQERIALETIKTIQEGLQNQQATTPPQMGERSPNV